MQKKLFVLVQLGYTFLKTVNMITTYWDITPYIVAVKSNFSDNPVSLVPGVKRSSANFPKLSYLYQYITSQTTTIFIVKHRLQYLPA